MCSFMCVNVDSSRGIAETDDRGFGFRLLTSKRLV